MAFSSGMCMNKNIISNLLHTVSLAINFIRKQIFIFDTAVIAYSRELRREFGLIVRPDVSPTEVAPVILFTVNARMVFSVPLYDGEESVESAADTLYTWTFTRSEIQRDHVYDYRIYVLIMGNIVRAVV